MTVTVRALTRDDHVWAAALLTANSAGRLTAEQRAAGGFVQGAFSPEKVAALAARTGGFVAEIDGERAGLALTSAADQVTDGPIGRNDEVAREHFGAGTYVMYGPIVVDAAHRRRGVSRALLDHARRSLSDRFAHGVAFIEDSNPVSLAAHRRLGLVEFATFEVGGRRYHSLSFDTRAGDD